MSPDETLLLTVSFDKTAALWTFADVLAPPATPRLEEPKAKDARIPQSGLVLPLGPQFAADLKFPEEGKFKRIGIIGLDTSHATAFTKAFNPVQFPNAKTNKLTEPAFMDQAPELEGFRVTAAFPKGSPDIESSTKRVPEYTQTVRDHNVKIVESIPELLKDVDYVLLETNDGRPHLEQVLPVLKAGKPVFVTSRSPATWPTRSRFTRPPGITRCRSSRRRRCVSRRAPWPPAKGNSEPSSRQKRRGP